MRRSSRVCNVYGRDRSVSTRSLCQTLLRITQNSKSCTCQIHTFRYEVTS
uniref:Uncharacterized protein n=1 Tax=Lepeophtheirus salmonis TaxID=72036 RepID=A0A0K2VG72_LEPSM